MEEDLSVDLDNEYSEEEEEEEEEERKEMIRQIEAYHRNFPEILSKRTNKSEEKLNEKITKKYSAITNKDKLRAELDGIKRQVSGTTMIKDLGSLFITGAFVLQDGGEAFGLKLKGPKIALADIVAQNQGAFSSVMRELGCKYNLEKYAEPEVRMGLLCLQCIGTCHISNKIAEETAGQVRKPIAIEKVGEIKLEV